MKLTFDAWKEGNVAPATSSVSVQPPPLNPDAPKAEPVSELFAGTLRHPVKTASLPVVRYSPDGTRLLAAGDMYSGVVQLWDVDARKEVLQITPARFERAKGQNQSFLAEGYALLSPDGQTLYVPTREAKTTRVERDGKKADLFEFTGRVRRWDVASKKELDPFTPPAGWGNFRADLSPDGKFLSSVEVKSRLRTDPPGEQFVVWDTATGKRTVIDGTGGSPRFLPGGKGVVTATAGKEGTVTVAVHPLADGKPAVSKPHAGGGGWATVADVSADGKRIAVSLGGGTKGKPAAILLLDADTLEETARWTGPANPFGFGHTAGVFTPDGKRFLVVDGDNALNVFDVAAKKVVRTVPLGGSSPRLVTSGDGRWFATAWTPDRDKLGNAPHTDPDLLPQPRVVLVDLKDPESKPATLVAPRGIAWGLAFRPDGKQLALGGTGGVHLFDLTKLGGR